MTQTPAHVNEISHKHTTYIIFTLSNMQNDSNTDMNSFTIYSYCYDYTGKSIKLGMTYFNS